jgi:hypothetical protein
MRDLLSKHREGKGGVDTRRKPRVDIQDLHPKKSKSIQGKKTSNPRTRKKREGWNLLHLDN